MGDLGFLPRFVLTLGRLWAKQIHCLQNGEGRLLECKPTKVETLFFRKQVLLRHFSFKYPVLEKAACIFTCHAAL